MTKKLNFPLHFIQTITEIAKKLKKQPFEIRKVSDFQVHRQSHHITKHEIEKSSQTWSELMKEHFPKPRDLWEVSANKQVRLHKNKLDATYGDRELFFSDFKKGLAEVLSKTPLIIHNPPPLIRQTNPIKRVLFAQLSDTHNGAHVLAPEVGGMNEYNWIICARRHAFFARTIAEYKLRHREHTSLRLGLNGDIIAGLIHNQEWYVDLLVNQFVGSLNVLVQFVTYLAGKFRFIEIDCTPGNHARSVGKKSVTRALVQKYDNYETILFFALKNVIEQSCQNVQINIPMAPYAEFTVFEHSYYQTHGDTVLTIENPGKKLDISSLRAQIDRINSAKRDKNALDVVMLGHYHTPTVQMLENGKVLIINGTLMGADPFAQGVGFHGNCPAQIIFEATKDYAVGDFRIERLLPADKDEELDKIIMPFKGRIE